MLTTPEEKAICKKYSAQDETGHVHCGDCPLNYAHDKKLKRWVMDE